MDLDTFRRRVLASLGEDLHRASPASVRDFVTELLETDDSPERRRFLLDESARSWEEVMRTFLARMLEVSADEAVMLLWPVTLELAYALIESDDEERLGALFRGIEVQPL